MKVSALSTNPSKNSKNTCMEDLNIYKKNLLESFV